MSEPAASSPAADDDMTRLSGWDALLDDLFGLNVRAIRSIGVAVARPDRLFEAARDADWLGRYTPSLRLVFTLIAATSVLKFLWAGDDSPLVRSIVDYLADVPLSDLPVPNVEETARRLMAQFLLLFPFTYFFCHFISSLLLRIWGKGTPAPVRIRLYFAALLPAIAFGLVQSLFYGLIPVEWIDLATLGSGIAGVAIYLITAFAGLAPRMKAGGRIWRAMLFALVALTTDLVISMLTYVLAFLSMYL
ncbi:MAG: hypothetical protein R3C13_12195 [Hyphomonas sp.]|uniref:hypothetical protein n=1 Tax=Hyphomonas sp. TaxID=87 RepID=UPI003526FB7B